MGHKQPEEQYSNTWDADPNLRTYMDGSTTAAQTGTFSQLSWIQTSTRVSCSLCSDAFGLDLKAAPLSSCHIPENISTGPDGNQCTPQFTMDIQLPKPERPPHAHNQPSRPQHHVCRATKQPTYTKCHEIANEDTKCLSSMNTWKCTSNAPKLSAQTAEFRVLSSPPVTPLIGIPIMRVMPTNFLTTWHPCT